MCYPYKELHVTSKDDGPWQNLNNLLLISTPQNSPAEAVHCSRKQSNRKPMRKPKFVKSPCNGISVDTIACRGGGNS